MRRLMALTILIPLVLTACARIELTPSVPVFDTGVDTGGWASIPAGEFLAGQYNFPSLIDYDYEIMVTDVTVSQYVTFLNGALSEGAVTVRGDAVVGYYPGDAFHEVKHELRIEAGEYVLVPLDDPASRFSFDGQQFMVKEGWGNHPMTNVSWFGARAYCLYHGWRLPTELEWEKAARGTDGRPFPWGNELTRQHTNFYASRDPFENMASYGSLTTPVGFYNGRMYAGYLTHDNRSPYGLYDMAGNIWQWTGDILPGLSDRFLRGGSKDSYERDLRVWVRNSAPPMYFGPGIGFRCAR